MVVLRVTGPAERAGMRVIRGNQGSRISFDGIAEADLVVIQRDFPRFWEDYRRVIHLARDGGKPVIYDLDDLLVEIPDAHSHRADYSGEMLTMLYAILDAEMVTASSTNLVTYLSGLNPNTRLLKNYLNDSLWEMKKSNSTPKKDSNVIIGYMGGQTHRADLEYIKSALRNVFEKFPGKVKFKFWGTQPPQDLLELPSTEFDPINLEDYARFANHFSHQECDIFIAPLADNEFNRAKSCIKFLEYSALGAPGVYSKLPPYENVIEHGENGFLADDLADWEECLSSFIDNPSLRHKLGVAAQETVREDWLLSSNHSQISDTYQSALEGYIKSGKDEKVNSSLKGIISRAEDYQSGIEERLFAADNQLNEIHGSRSWKLLKHIQALRQKVVPKR